MRLNRYLAQCGLGARRKVEQYIVGGDIFVNGSVMTNLAYQVHPEDEVYYQNTRLHGKTHEYVVLNKPKNCLCTRGSRGMHVYDLLPSYWQHLNYIGRLDRDTTGLLLFSNDGDLAQALAHPAQEVAKIYLVYTHRPVEQYDLTQLRKGFELSDGFIRADQVELVGYDGVHIQLHSGRNRIVRRMMEALEYDVVHLERIGYGSLYDLGLRRGQSRLLTPQEVASLRSCAKGAGPN